MKDVSTRGPRRVVITGVGALTPLGLSVEESWKGLVDGRSGIAPITLFDTRDIPVKIAGEVHGFVPENYMDRKEARRLARATQLGLAAAMEAMGMAGLDRPFEGEEAARAGIIMGTGIGGFDEAEKTLYKFWQGGFLKVSPFSIAAGLVNMPTYQVAMRYNVQGHSNTISTACAAGTQAAGMALDMIRRGKMDVVITGGMESMINSTAVAGFAAMRALSRRNEEPGRASRPFDAERDGLVVGEGAAVFVLESLEHALARGVESKILAEVLGEATGSDTYHITMPDPEGVIAARTMRQALEDAGVSPDEVDYVNAHATGTRLGDPAETAAIKRVFGPRAYDIPVSATKSMTGHSLGASGAIELMACVMTVKSGIIHPTINYEYPDPECDLDYVPNQARRAEVDVVLSNSFGFGGQNACLVLRKYRP